MREYAGLVLGFRPTGTSFEKTDAEFLLAGLSDGVTAAGVAETQIFRLYRNGQWKNTSAPGKPISIAYKRAGEHVEKKGGAASFAAGTFWRPASSEWPRERLSEIGREASPALYTLIFQKDRQPLLAWRMMDAPGTGRFGNIEVVEGYAALVTVALEYQAGHA